MIKGLLIVISGPSGSGKGTVLNKVIENNADICFSVSTTTRDMRPGDVDGRDYIFITREAFEAEINSGNMLEFAEYADNYYGTPKKYVEAMISSGKTVILEIEVQGAMQIRQKCPDAVLIFLCPPDIKTLEQRLRDRNTESEEKIEKRLSSARYEISFADRYDYIVINRDGKTDEAAAEITAIIKAQKQNPDMREPRNNADIIHKFLN